MFQKSASKIRVVEIAKSIWKGKIAKREVAHTIFCFEISHGADLLRDGGWRESTEKNGFICFVKLHTTY